MLYYTWKEIAKHGEVLKQSSISCTSREKHKGQQVDYKGTTNANPVNDIQTKISSLTERKEPISFWNRRWPDIMASGWMTVWRLDTRAKRFGRARSRWWKQRYNLGAISPRKRRNANRGVERGLRGLKEMYGEREYHFRSDPRRRDNAHLH